MLKKFSSDKINGTKNPLLFLYDSLRAEAQGLFVCLKPRVGFSIFDSISFSLKFIFFFNKMHGLFDFKTS